MMDRFYYFLSFFLFIYFFRESNYHSGNDCIQGRNTERINIYIFIYILKYLAGDFHKTCPMLTPVDF